jgi:hypothetical protein
MTMGARRFRRDRTVPGPLLPTVADVTADDGVVGGDLCDAGDSNGDAAA